MSELNCQLVTIVNGTGVRCFNAVIFEIYAYTKTLIHACLRLFREVKLVVENAAA